MPLRRLLVILATVIVAAAATDWIAFLAMASFDLPASAGAVALPVLMIGYLVWRFLGHRGTSEK